jgi:hypothetical protein
MLRDVSFTRLYLSNANYGTRNREVLSLKKGTSLEIYFVSYFSLFQIFQPSSFLICF